MFCVDLDRNPAETYELIKTVYGLTSEGVDEIKGCGEDPGDLHLHFGGYKETFKKWLTCYKCIKVGGFKPEGD